MDSGRRIEFSIRDRVDSVEITAATIGLSRFNEFNRQVEDFIAGSQNLRLDEVIPSVESGSYRLSLLLPAPVALALEPDLKRLEDQASLGEIDPKRAGILERWQAQSRQRPGLEYSITGSDWSFRPIRLNHTTDFRSGDLDPWVHTERYLIGTVLDMGGAKKANVHLRLDGTNQIVRLATQQNYLSENSNDRLYRKVLARVAVDQHFRTGQLRNFRLLGFEKYEPHFDEAAFTAFTEAGRIAWADVPDAATWVHELRGGSI